MARPLRLPVRAPGEPALAVITVGGATLGGSGKTRVALACAQLLAERGANVVLIGHAYRAAPSRARVVLATDALAEVGDEALLCARALASGAAAERARVVVGPTRQAAIDHAASLVPRARVIVIDGPLQLAPAKASLALLAVDAESPWGAGALPPAGDLRAPREALLEAADRLVEVGATPAGARLDGRTVALGDLAELARKGARIGLFTAMARPARLLRSLAGAGVPPAIVVQAPDHGPLTPAVARALSSADLWLATAKCALHLEGLEPAVRVAILDGRIELPPALAGDLLLACDMAPHGLP